MLVQGTAEDIHSWFNDELNLSQNSTSRTEITSSARQTQFFKLLINLRDNMLDVLDSEKACLDNTALNASQLNNPETEHSEVIVPEPTSVNTDDPALHQVIVNLLIQELSTL